MGDNKEKTTDATVTETTKTDLAGLLARSTGSAENSADRVIAIGASTGGIDAIRQIIGQLPAGTPGVVITQHISSEFGQSLAESLDKASLLKVQLAADGDRIVPGNVYLAPGGRHLLIERGDNGYRCKLDDGPAVNQLKPSVDAMFHSLAVSAASRAVGVLLTGMGKDGAEGLLAMHQRGAYTIAQDEDTSVVWGMPGEAVKIKAVNAIVSVDNMAQQILVGLSN